jgi:hypothetical protein
MKTGLFLLFFFSLVVTGVYIFATKFITRKELKAVMKGGVALLVFITLLFSFVIVMSNIQLKVF